MSFLMTLVKLLKKPQTLIIVLLGLLLLALYVWGAKLGVNLMWRLIIGGVLLVAGVVVAWLVGRIEKRRQADRIEQSLVLEAAGGGGSDDKARRRQAREEMAAAIARLKSSRLADGRSGRDALSILPWYLVLGAPGSGKSALIAGSGLPFPTTGNDPAEACTVGSNCCWWFSNQAVLLEADGRFAQDPGRGADADWEIFLELLRKQQRDPALNGILVTLPADDLVGRDEAWLRERASLWRRRLDGIAGSLELLCPVYLVITRCDLINGFQEFFGDLQGSARDQVWGATIGGNLMTAAVPGDVLAQEFDLLLRALDRRRLSRLVRTEQDRNVQQQAFLFPLEFARLRDKLRAVCETLLAPSSYAHQPPWRGFYFTSVGGGQARPAETVLTDVSQVIGLPGFAGYTPPPPVSGRPDPRFLKTLFLNVLVPDHALARPTARALRRRHWGRLAVRAAATLALPILLTVVGVSLVRNLQLAGESRRLAEQVRGVAPAGEQARDLAAALAQLDPLRLHLEQLDRWQHRTPLSLGAGLYRGDDLARGLRRLYLERLRTVLLRPSRDRLERDLLGAYPNSREEFNRYFDRYQVYRMLIQPEFADPGLVARELRALWHGAGGDLTETTTRQLELIDQHVDHAWRHPMELRDAASDLPRARENLVQRAEGLIREFWASDLYYDNLVAAVNREGRPFSTEIEPAFSGVLTGAAGSDPAALVIPYAFTREGWQQHVLPRIAGSERELKDNWLLQEAFRERTLDIRSELLARYLGEHHRRWVAFLGAVDLAPSVRLGETHTRLRTLAARTSALFRFLERVRDTSDLSGAAPGLVESDVAALERATNDFRSWREFFRSQGQGDAAREPAGTYANLLDELVQFLGQIVQEGDPQANAAAATRQVFQTDGRGGTALEAVSRQVPGLIVEGGASSCERALETFLRRPVRLVWDACLRATEEHLGALWRDTVVREFTTRLGGYPLNPEAGNDVSVRDYATFFRAGGTLDQFVSEQLGDFLTRERRPRTVLDRQLRVREEASAAIRRADQQRRVLFPAGAAAPRAVFRLRPLQASYARGTGPAITGTRLRIGEQTLFYDMGAPRNPEFVWSGEEFGLRASLSLQPDGVFAEHRIEASDWALFRLLDRAEIVAQGDSRFQVNWFLADPQNTYRVRVPYELTADSAENPFARGFFTFALPSRLFP